MASRYIYVYMCVLYLYINGNIKSSVTIITLKYVNII